MGRSRTLLKQPNGFEMVIFRENPHEILKILDMLIDLSLICLEKPYAVGCDEKNDVISRTHYHIRGYTKFLKSGLEPFRCTDVYKSFQKGDITLISKVLAKDTDDAWLRYALKDKLVKTHLLDDTWLKINIPLAQREYKYKLDGKRKRLQQKEEELDVYEYIDTKITHYDKKDDNDKVSTFFIGTKNGNIRDVELFIIEYAILKNKKHLLSKNNLKTTSLLYMGRKGYLDTEDIYDIIMN